MEDSITHNNEEIEKLKDEGLIFNYKNIPVTENIFIHLFQCSYKEPLTLVHHFKNAEDNIGFNFFLSGKTRFMLSNGYSITNTGNKMLSNFFMPSCNVNRQLELTPQLSLITCFMKPQVFGKLTGESTGLTPEKLVRIESRKNLNFEFANWQPVVYSILEKIFYSEMRPVARRIFLENKILELCAIIADIYAKREEGQLATFRKEIDIVQNANELSLKKISDIIGLSELSMVNTTTVL